MFPMIAALALSALPPEETASIQREQQKALADVAEKHGNKKSTELSGDERRDMIREQAEAEQKVLDKHGVSKKEWAVGRMRESPDERAQVKQAAEALEAKEKAQAEAAAKPKEERAVTVQRGFSEENPTVMEEKAGNGVSVEKELPAEAKADQDAAAEADRANGFSGASGGGEKSSKGSGEAKGGHKGGDGRHQR